MKKIVGTSLFSVLVLGVASLSFTAVQAKANASSNGAALGHLPEHGHTYGANPGHGGLPPGQLKHEYGNDGEVAD